MPPTFERHLARTVQAYLPVAEDAERFCAEQGLAKSLSFKLRLILEELIQNVIDHAVGSATDRIGLRIEMDPSQVTLILEDDGVPFDPRSVPAFDKTKPFEERGPRGMGIHLVRSMADDLAYERIDGHNRIQVMLLRD